MDLLGQLLISLVVAVVSAAIAVHLALRRFRAERWWERKVDAYASILEALHVMKQGLQDDLDQMDSPGRRRDSEYEAEQIKEFRLAREHVYKAIDTGSFLLAPQASSLLQQLKGGLESAFTGNQYDGALDVPAMLHSEMKALGECLDKLPAIARQDLKIRVEGWAHDNPT